MCVLIRINTCALCASVRPLVTDDIMTDDDYGAIHVDGGGDENEDLLEDEENNIVDKVPL